MSKTLKRIIFCTVLVVIAGTSAIAISQWDNFRSGKFVKDLDSQIKITEAELINQVNDFNELEKEIQTLKQQLNTIDIEEYESLINGYINNIEELNQSVINLNNQKRDLQNELDTQIESNQALENQIEQLQAEIERLQHELAHIERIQCAKCGGSGTYGEEDCSLCGGDGYTSEHYEHCHECGSSGHTYSYDTCPTCGGSGYDYENYADHCVHCRGIGVCIEDCPYCCYGKDYNNPITCEHCENGYLPNSCEVCNGTNCVDCPYCEEGTEQCYNCQGTGEYSFNKHCTDCGETNSEYASECYSCHSTNLTTTCQDCNGSGCVECSSCFGIGETSCNCGGITEMCTYCSGQGYTYPTCEICRGDCTYMTNCTSCNGTGENCDSPSTCDNCYGNGTIDNYITCPTCAGNGYEIVNS